MSKQRWARVYPAFETKPERHRANGACKIRRLFLGMEGIYDLIYVLVEEGKIYRINGLAGEKKGHHVQGAASMYGSRLVRKNHQPRIEDNLLTESETILKV
jgi:hypothetical protein